jgi:hypothetical protein
MATEERTQKSATADLPQEYRGPGRWSGMMGMSSKWSIPIGIGTLASAYSAAAATVGAILPSGMQKKVDAAGQAAYEAGISANLGNRAAQNAGEEAVNGLIKKGTRNTVAAALAVVVPGTIYALYKGYQKGAQGEQDYKNALKRAEDLAIENEKLKIDKKWADRLADQRGQSAEHASTITR